MWARSAEVMLALWLAAAPFVFGHYGRLEALTASDFAAAGAVAVLALASYADRLRRAHLGILAVSAWLVGFGYFGFAHPAPPGAQNEILTGLTLVLLAIIPMDAERPPRAWREFLERSALRPAPRAPSAETSRRRHAS